MPITPYLNGEQFDPESMRVLGVAFGLVCIALQVEGSGDDVKQAIANKVIEFAKAGTRNPDLLCEPVLEDIAGRLRVKSTRRCSGVTQG
jgi:hypothetical protein